MTFSRRPCKRQWSASKDAGPTFLAAEWILKKLKHHSWPAKLRVEGEYIHFDPEDGHFLGPDFGDALDLASRIIGHEKRINTALIGRRFWLAGPHYIDYTGKVRRGHPDRRTRLKQILKETPPMIYQRVGNIPIPVNRAILHCADVPTGWWKSAHPLQLVANLRTGHVRDRGWSDLGYHYVVFPKGEIIQGRPLDKVGAHVIGHNRGTLGILLIEQTEITQMGTFPDFYTNEQRCAVRELCKHHGIDKITGHNDYAKKLCPGFRVDAEYFLGNPLAPAVYNP